jgi:ribonucleoside-diphosphate reductase alpha chain/ribonucleoside-triphosphate reductase
MSETPLGVDGELSASIAREIEAQTEKADRAVHVEDLQDLVEDFLMSGDRKDVAKNFSICRYERD